MAIGSDPDVVHETRKAIKRMRALARLFREDMGEPEFERLDRSLRDAGRRLAGARDAQVRLATLSRLAERHPKALSRRGIDLLGAHLEHECAHADEPAGSAEVLADIATMRGQLARWNLVERDFEDLEPGLERIYKEGRTRYGHAKDEQGQAHAGVPRPSDSTGRAHPRDVHSPSNHADPTDAQDTHPPSDQAMHDWRKRVKSLYYALDMLGGKHAKGARKATRRADRLGDLLGEEHDLWLLGLYATEHPEAFGEDLRARADLLELIERHRTRLRKRTLKLGGRLYKRPPARFARRLRRAFSR